MPFLASAASADLSFADVGNFFSSTASSSSSSHAGTACNQNHNTATSFLSAIELAKREVAKGINKAGNVPSASVLTVDPLTHWNYNTETGAATHLQTGRAQLAAGRRLLAAKGNMVEKNQQIANEAKAKDAETKENPPDLDANCPLPAYQAEKPCECVPIMRKKVSSS